MNLKADKLDKERIYQGDIIREVECIEGVSEKDGIIELSKVVFPLVIVLTQDCDLEQDYKLQRDHEKKVKDKLLLSVLVAPLYNATHVVLGEHLSQLKIGMEPINWNKTPGKFLKNNDRPRYHYLEFPDDINVVPSIIDFKHYFSVNASYLSQHKKSNYVCTLSSLYREDVLQRFAAFLSRIGLPDIHTSAATNLP